MSEHRVGIIWERGSAPFEYESFSRDHVWTFSGGQRVRASAAPGFFGNADCSNPEEALVAALASCHMLTFLAIAAKKRLVVARYEDEAVGILGKDEEGRYAVTRIVLRPRVEFEGRVPEAGELERLHASAHRHCFIAHSIRSEVQVEPQPSRQPVDS